MSSQKVLPHLHYILNVVFYTPGFLFPNLNLTRLVSFQGFTIYKSDFEISCAKERQDSNLNWDGNSPLDAQKSSGEESTIRWRAKKNIF